MRTLAVADYSFRRVELTWHGPYEWNVNRGRPDADKDILRQRGIYRAETKGRNRNIIKYIGSASNSFNNRFNNNHRIKQELVDRSFRKVRVFLATVQPEDRISIERRHFVEMEYILQNVHYHELVSWHGLGSLPKTSRGEGWKIVNKGVRGDLHRIIHYPTFAVSVRDR